MDENEVVAPGADEVVVDAPEVTEEEVAPEAAPETGDEEAAA